MARFQFKERGAKARARTSVAALREDRAERLLKTTVSWSPDGSVELTLTREFLIPESEGVYMIHDLRGVLYVGLSRNLRQRFVQHDRLRRNRLLRLAIDRRVGVMSFSWRLMPDDTERSSLERQLIAVLQPVCNRQLLDTPLACP